MEKSLERADAILILSGSGVFLERTQKAAELYRNGVSSKIFLTDDGERAGWSEAEKRNPPYVELARKKLIEFGVRAEDILILEPQVYGTIDEARITAQKAKEDNLRSILLVTSAYHTRRTLWIFQKIFSENAQKTEIGIAPVETGIQTPGPRWWWLSPLGWQNVAGEYVKSFVYWAYY